MTSFFDLPEDVVIEILSWLPADSLLQFKCVNRSWYSLIKSPQLVKKQLCNHVRSTSSTYKIKDLCIFIDCLVRVSGKEDKGVQSLLIYDDKKEVDFEEDDISLIVKNFSSPYSKNFDYQCISDQCDGIICLYDISSHMGIAIANLVSREFKRLPQSCIPIPSCPYELRNCTILCRVTRIVGIGYNNKSNDYKVVKVNEFENCFASYCSPRVEVYSLSSNTWKDIGDLTIRVDNLQDELLYKYWNGYYFWHTHQLYDGKEVILRFDFNDETFQSIPMPEHLCIRRIILTRLMEWNETLALLAYHSERKRTYLELWVMDEFSENGSWAKILTFQPHLSSSDPLTFINRDIILMLTEYGQVVSYNRITKHIKLILNLYERYYTRLNVLKVINYKRSLLSIL